jgi:UDP-3-O-[3-hydroxymyristoyl] glucosamine N-acyltransferase
LRFTTAVTTGRVAELVGGDINGPTERSLAGVAPLHAAGPGDLAFAAGPDARANLRATRAGAVLVPAELAADLPRGSCAIVVETPVRAVQQVMAMLGARRPSWGIHPTAQIGRGAHWAGRVCIGAHAVVGGGVELGEGCVIEAGAVIEDGAVLGAGCRVGAGATVHRDALLGERVVIRGGARVGGSGFGFVREGGCLERVPHFCGCRIGDDVEIGANTTVDRGAARDTVIGEGTKIDNLVQVAHNVQIGRHCVVMAQTGIAGSCTVEDDVMLAGQVGIADHLRIGAGSRVAAQSGVIGDVPPGATVSGYPARDHRSVLRQTAALARLAPLITSIERIVQRDE